MFWCLKKNPAMLLKEATAKKNLGDINGAIENLREAFKGIEKDSVVYPVKTFLRLPLYLQEAGMADEAWREFNVLLTSGYPNQPKSIEIMSMEHSLVYDKMRLFLQREGKNDAAIKFGVFSYISWAVGLCYQKRHDELHDYKSMEYIEEVLSKVLKKAKRKNLLADVAGIVEEELKGLPVVDFGKLAERIDSVIGLK